ncbi:S1 family peptidase [Streptomyces sp. MP131-18]|uniref:S1 family peptidase n=1 Tax=Streptomyces sp. MP131-18 TaxID=1857892 RepID=UPI00097C95DD|nr:S1 family peptidase [Streptomyces sp. MP131-18]ONK11318.1 Alpha-lytic protease precursor [Streptomyces sp. MP131-18]
MRRTSRLRLRVWASALLLVGALGATEAAAAPAPAEPPAAPGLVEAMQRDLGLTEDQALDRIADEAAAAEAQPAATSAAGDAFAGAWFDPAAGALVVAVADPGAADAVRDAGAEALVVEHSAAELDAVVTGLGAADAPEGVVGWHADAQANTVVVEVVRGAADEPAVAAFLDEARATGPVAVRAVADEAPAPFAAGTVGGDPYYTGNVRCSIGFSVHGGFVTAGHCGQPGADVFGWDRSRLGTFQAASWPGNDYGWVSVGHGWWTEPVVLGWGTVSDALVRGSAEAPIGASVCRSGSTTGWHCGTVLGKNETVRYVDGEVVNGLTRTSVCAQPGDSGGSYISGDQAQGVTSGGWGDCNSGGETWHQPVNEILSAYGLTLHTA